VRNRAKLPRNIKQFNPTRSDCINFPESAFSKKDKLSELAELAYFSICVC